MNSLEQARRIAALAQEKLAEDVVVLDMRSECTFTDYFVIVTGRNARQTVSIWDEVHEKMKQEGRHIPRSVDGVREGTWILADYLDVVLHVFTPEARACLSALDISRATFTFKARTARFISPSPRASC